jgi:hypothetical protein
MQQAQIAAITEKKEF